MSERVWHKGPPPFPGWWSASYSRLENIWRWWNGRSWSSPAHKYDRPDAAADCACHPDLSATVSDIEWTDYWPENARVPRLDPTGGHWTFNVDGQEPDYRGYIELAFRNESKRRKTVSSQWDWVIRGNGGDILAWRPAA